MKELSIPPDVGTDRQARELVRVWAAHGEQHVSLDVNAWPDPAAWGLLLVDLAHHVANAYADSRGLDPVVTLARIREAFEAELNSPTD